MFLLASALAPMSAMVATGSRGGIASFILGASVYLLPDRRSRRLLGRFLAAVMAVLIVGFFVSKSRSTLDRWEDAYEGNLASREEIYPQAIQMFSERPIFGWHSPTEFGYALGERLGLVTGKDAHNLLLHLLLEGGVVGAFLFLFGMFVCAKAAWNGRGGSLGYMPFALFVTTIACNTANTFAFFKPQWFVLALAMSCVPQRVVGMWGRRKAPPNLGRFKAQHGQFRFVTQRHPRRRNLR